MEENKLIYSYTDKGVMIDSGTAYIAYICMGGSGFNVAVRTRGEWQEGADEIIGVYDSMEEARNAIDDYIKSL